MSIVNFAISKPLEKQVNQTIKEKGFASKAEFFRFLAFRFFDKEENYDKEIGQLVKEINEISKKIDTSKIPSLEDQLADL